MAKTNETARWAVELGPQPKKFWMIAAGAAVKNC